MNNTTFFAYARRAPFGGRLSSAQVDGLAAILAEAARRKTPRQHLAYMLATAFHETGGKMQPVRENLNYTSAARIKQTWPSRFASIAEAQPYVGQPQKLANKVYGGRLGNTGPNDGWIYRGDGLPQLTGKANFTKFGVEPGMDLATAVRVMFDGMTKGMFTGKRLDQYFGEVEAPVAARAIVNGSDKAKLIAGYYRNFLDALAAAEDVTVRDATPEAAKPDDVPLTESGAVKTILLGGGGTLVTSLVAAVSNPWAFATVALVIVMAAAGFWLVKTGQLELKRAA
jgi:putative chitinase